MRMRLLLLIITAITIVSCNGARKSETFRLLEDVDSYIEARPDSALAVLEGIDKDALKTKELEAKYEFLAIEAFIEARIPYGPGKAVNAGGVATSGLEMSQNSMKLSWSAAEVDEKLQGIMASIHRACIEYGSEADGYINYMKGANIAGFMKVAKSMVEQGII